MGPAVPSTFVPQQALARWRSPESVDAMRISTQHSLGRFFLTPAALSTACCPAVTPWLSPFRPPV